MAITLLLALLPIFIQLMEWYIDRKWPVPKVQHAMIAHILTQLNERQSDISALPEADRLFWQRRVDRFRQLSQELNIQPE